MHTNQLPWSTKITRSGHYAQSEVLWPKNHRCVVCGRDTIYKFCGRPMCPTCKERLHDQLKGDS